MFMSNITLKSRITNNNMYYQPMKKSHIHLKSPGIISVHVGMNISGPNDLTCYYDNSYES
jgi:hypothetical protein